MVLERDFRYIIGVGSRTFRTRVPAVALENSSNRIRILVSSQRESENQYDWAINEAWIGHASGANFDFDGNQKQITFNNGSSSIYIPGSAAAFWTDEMDVDINSDTDLIISWWWNGVDGTGLNGSLYYPASTDIVNPQITGTRWDYISGNFASETIWSGDAGVVNNQLGWCEVICNVA
jgi:hypothetical protein